MNGVDSSFTGMYPGSTNHEAHILLSMNLGGKGRKEMNDAETQGVKKAL